MDAIILAAGKGLRLRPHTETKPKGLVDIAGKPLLAYTLETLPSDITHIHFVIGYLGEQIKTHFGESYNNIPISYHIQEPLTGTASALSLLKGKVSASCLVINGDDLYSPEDIQKLANLPCALLARKEDNQLQASIITQQGFVSGIGPNPPGSPAYRVCGAYTVTEDYFNFPPIPIPVRDTIEYSLPHTLVSMADKIKIALVESSFWQPVGTPEELEKAIKIKLSGQEDK